MCAAGTDCRCAGAVRQKRRREQAGRNAATERERRIRGRDTRRAFHQRCAQTKSRWCEWTQRFNQVGKGRKGVFKKTMIRDTLQSTNARTRTLVLTRTKLQNTRFVLHSPKFSMYGIIHTSFWYRAPKWRSKNKCPGLIWIEALQSQGKDI